MRASRSRLRTLRPRARVASGRSMRATAMAGPGSRPSLMRSLGFMGHPVCHGAASARRCFAVARTRRGAAAESDRGRIPAPPMPRVPSPAASPALQIAPSPPQYPPPSRGLPLATDNQQPATLLMKKLLVANRSEIAIRVFRAATELGLTTVAIYTYEDRFSLHRFKADEAYSIGPEEGGEPVKGYLNIEALIAIARAHGVDAIHPGYGFLSENAGLARACRDNGIIFVGPTPELLEQFGDKTEAKRLAVESDVPTVPGTDDALQDLKSVKSAAGKIGYPIIIKASFGGGGRGMRVVKNAEELAGKLEEAQREAGAAFGRPEVFVEKYIARAKHIEVQVLGDTHGNLVHLWERDCSVQRRHQKVVEVAPSIDLPRGLRERIRSEERR